jgi:hypothetical protein
MPQEMKYPNPSSASGYSLVANDPSVEAGAEAFLDEPVHAQMMGSGLAEEKGHVDAEGDPLVIVPGANLQEIVKLKKKNYYWQKAIEAFNLMAELSNVGIFYKVVSSWLPFIQALGPILGLIAGIADPMIYFFRSLIRVTRIVGREYFDITFDEEEKGKHKWQTHGDLASLGFFALAIPLFFGLIIASPVGITVAWGLAIAGLAVSAYFDYAYPARCAKKHFIDTLAAGAPQLEVDQAYEEYQTKKIAKRFFFALVFSISLLVLCTSAAAFAPPMIVPALFILSKIASICLALIAVGRFSNAYQKKIEAKLRSVGRDNEHDHQKDMADVAESKNDNVPSLSPPPSPNSSTKMALAIALADSPNDEIKASVSKPAIKVVIPTSVNPNFTVTVMTPKAKSNSNQFFQDAVRSQDLQGAPAPSQDKGFVTEALKR